MATTLPTDTKFRDPFFQSGYSEVIAQAVDKFNAGSNGTIRLTSNRKPGDYDYAAFFKNAGGLVSRQDQTSVAIASGIKLSQDEYAAIKLNRKIGPVEWTRSAFLKPGLSQDAIRVAAGEQVAKDVLADMLNNAIRAGRAALSGNAANKFTVPTNGTMATTSLVSGLALYGDAASRIDAWVMHSKVAFDLLQYQIAPSNNGDVVANTAVVAASPLTLNRPIIVTDSDALAVTTGSGTAAVTDYFTLGLSADALRVEDTEEEHVVIQEVTGLEQLLIRMQGEFAYNVGIKGFTWDVSNGGKNPSDSALGTSDYWDKVFTSHKDLAGVVIQSR
ncbi:hypothetical protein CSC70_03830 [Pseudoxanthomonas kalamensis DSM 18571]|uniref:major capsid protein n=1 Tax=Pseudoxanthomonas kalamensis TaxID=289483 RepID=UPI0013915864|nr:major capsid protein [Pseudoxanthomonas kalamensis]KAF1711067.1 hypothetical protein CSC70_03830 [Pseudoxanthomonas kalamensis DSM 18571]